MNCARLNKCAFSILEMLVAMVILALMVLLIAQIISISSRSLQSNSRKLDGIAEGRFVLDRLGFDLASRVRRPDVPARFSKNPGNDTLGFYGEIEGYGGQRKVSVVDYRVQETAPGKRFKLERAVIGTGWSGGGVTLNFLPTSLAAPNDTDYDVLSEGVLRLEFCYLKKDGTLSNSAPTAPADLAGFVVATAILDPKSRQMLDDEQLKRLAEALPDSREGEAPLSDWQEARKDPGFAQGVPPQALEALRFSQRYYYAY